MKATVRKDIAERCESIPDAFNGSFYSAEEIGESLVLPLAETCEWMDLEGVIVLLRPDNRVVAVLSIDLDFIDESEQV